MGTLNTLSVALPPQKLCVCISLLITLNLPALASISQIPKFTLEHALTADKLSFGKGWHCSHLYGSRKFESLLVDIPLLLSTNVITVFVIR